MATIDQKGSYPSELRFWDFLKNTLVEVFGLTPDGAGALIGNLRGQLQGVTPEERLLFFHAEPFAIAQLLTGVIPGTVAYVAYGNLKGRWKWGP